MKNYKDFKEIKRAYKNSYLQSMRASVDQIKEVKGTFEEMIQNWRIKRYLSVSQRAKAQARKLNIKEIKTLIIEKIKKETYSQIEAFNLKCDEIAQAEDIKSITIRVDWVKNRTWGLNPHCETLTSNGYYNGVASGCGYDKLSTSIAQALNQDTSILKRLYNKYEEALRKGVSPREFVGYGSGYITPYFDGGVGYGSFRNIFNNLGAKVNQWNETKTSDFMYIEF